MSFACFICSGAFTNPGTQHSLYTTNCGHLVGLSCMERWKIAASYDVFKCPNCLKRLANRDYHPVYGIPDEIFNPQHKGSLKAFLDDEDVTQQYLLGNFKKVPIFLKTINEEIDGNVEIFDAYNGYILIVGFAIPKKKDSKFVKIISSINNKVYFTKLSEQSFPTAAVFNKCRNDVVEFIIGFKNGCFQIITCSLDLSQIISNIVHCCGHGKIQSLTFLGKNLIAYSVDQHGVFVSNTDNLFKSTSWTKLKDSERGLVTSLQKLKDNVLIGMIKNAIYVFEKYEDSYTLYYDADKKIINFKVDISTNMLIIFCSEKEIVDGTTKISQFYVLCKIKEVASRRSRGPTKNTYHTSTVKIVKIKDGNLGSSIKSEVLLTKVEEKFRMFSFVPNIKNNIIEAFHIDNGINCISVEGFDNLNECLGVLCISEPQILSPTFFKIKIAVILANKLVILNFYCPITDD